jgi:polyamine oxidase
MLGEERYKVLILGAGMAGISAAQTLYDAGITNFRVLEATERIGGRLLMKKFDGGVVELGGNWVHGTDCNPIWKLVQEAGLEHVDTMIAPEEGKYIVLDENGVNVTPQDRHEAMEEAEACLERLREKYSGDTDFAVSTGLKECKWDPQGPAGTAIEYYYHDFDAAVPPEEISAGALLDTGNERLEEHIDSTGGRQVLISDPRGYASIISNMAKKFEDQVLTNHVVENIVWNEADVSVVVNDINVGKTRTIKADFVLVTFSIGVLRKHVLREESMFNPTLPQRFRSSLDKMRMANYLKIFLKFSERFWPEQYDYIFYASKKRGLIHV